MRWTADKALEFWEEEGLLTKEKASELRGSLKEESEHVPSRAIAVFAAVGALLVGLGIILFIASNWQEMTPVVKVALLLIGMIGTGVAGYALSYEQARYEKTGLAILLVNAFLYGASIFLIGQIYNLPLNFWWGMLLWCVGVSFFAYAMQSKLHLWLACPIFVFFLGWLRSSSVVGFNEFSFLFSDSANILTLLPAVGVGFMSLGVLHRLSPRTAFGESILFHWGLFLFLLALVITTIDKGVLFALMRFTVEPVTITTLALSALALASTLVFGRFVTSQGKWALLFLGLYVAFVYALTFAPEWAGVPAGVNRWMYLQELSMFKALHVLHVLMVFLLLLVIVWYGTLLKFRGMINIGMIGLGLVILIQYFSWAFEQLERSFAFILGGIIILILSAILESKRRTLLSSIARK